MASAKIDSEAAANGEDAIKLLAETSAGTFDLFLLDVLMPGMDGWELLERIRKNGDETPVIF